MPTIKNIGCCMICNENIEHNAIKKHITQCLEKHQSAVHSSEKEKIFLIKITHGKIFWLYVEINGSLTLGELDYFLRATWLECCGHMSQFIIGNKRYTSNGEMNKVIHRLFKTDRTFDYEYDFGSTTELKGEVVSIRPGELEDGIRLVAQNNFPEAFTCSLCQKKSDVICTLCNELFCEACSKKDDCDEEGEGCYMLPVVNSPRMGVCGYTGPDDNS